MAPGKCIGQAVFLRKGYKGFQFVIAVKSKRIAVAGGIKPNNVEEAIEKGANIIIAGRYIIGSRDVRRAAQDFLEHFDPDPDNMRLAMDEDENIDVKDD